MIEGTDGSGKTIQFRRLIRKLKKNGFRVSAFDFLQYKKPSSYFVREYLNGRYGGWREVGPKRASLFYALDRFDAARRIQSELEAGHVVVANRYIGSNLAHQGSKMTNRKERRAFFKWVYELEYGMLGIPRPDRNLVLRVPAHVAQALVDKKGTREYIAGKKRDIHEEDIKHLKRAEEAYGEIVGSFPKDFMFVECMEKGKLLSPERVHERVWKIVKGIVSR